MSPEGIHIIRSPARPPLLLSTDTNPTHTDAFSTWSLLWPSAPRTRICARKFFPSVPFISWRQLIYKVNSCFHNLFLFSSGWQASGAETMSVHLPIPSSLVIPTSHAMWIDHHDLSCWPLWSCSASKHSAGCSRAGLILKSTANGSIHSLIHSLRYSSFTQHILARWLLCPRHCSGLILCLLLNHPFHPRHCTSQHRAKPLLPCASLKENWVYWKCVSALSTAQHGKELRCRKSPLASQVEH